MSVPTKEQASRFLSPLRGNLAVLLLHDIQPKTLLSRFILRCARLESAGTSVLDVDAFFCSNIDAFADDAESMATAELLLLPENDFDASSLLPLLFSGKDMLIIDDLNSLYSLSSNGQKLHQLTILMRLLSLNARVNRSWVIAIAYRTEQGVKQGGTDHRSLTSLGDLLVDTDFHGGSLKLRAGFDSQWPNNELEV